jgi:hypothetical protein
MFSIIARPRIFPLGQLYLDTLFYSNQESIVKGSHQFTAVLRPVLPILSNPKKKDINRKPIGDSMIQDIFL